MVERLPVKQLVAGSNPARGALRQAQGLYSELQYNMKQWYLYILFCDQKIFYIGITDNLRRRLLQHQSKESPYTKQFSDIQLVYYEIYNTKKEAEKREAQIKKWSRAKKKALIRGDILLLKKLSKGREIVDDLCGKE